MTTTTTRETGLRAHWVRLLYAAATGTRKTRAILTPVGLIVFAVFTTGFVFAALLLDRLLGLPGLLPDGARSPLAIALIATGAALTAWSALHFLRVKGTPVPFNPPPELVATGPYRHARNPMLAGVFLFLFGLGFALDSFSLVVFFTPLYIAANIWELRQIEEPELGKRLGKEYIAYREQTPMFIPRLRNRS